MKELKNTMIDDFKTGLINLNTRKFGTAAELIFQKLFNLDDSHTLAYDKFDKNEGIIEIKCSRVFERNNVKKITLDNVKQVCLDNSKSLLTTSTSNDNFCLM